PITVAAVCPPQPARGFLRYSTKHREGRFSVRRLSLLGKFALVSAVCMAVLGLALARSETLLIRNRALDDARSSGQLLAQVGLQSHLTSADVRDGLSPEKLSLLDDAYRTALTSHSIARIKIWSTRGAIVYSDDHAL